MHPSQLHRVSLVRVRDRYHILTLAPKGVVLTELVRLGETHIANTASVLSVVEVDLCHKRFERVGTGCSFAVEWGVFQPRILVVCVFRERKLLLATAGKNLVYEGKSTFVQYWMLKINQFAPDGAFPITNLENIFRSENNLVILALAK